MLSLPKMIAHRGASAYAPENTLAALEKAYEMGATWVEFDVQLSKDHVPIVIHDDDLNRTTTGQGLIIEKDWAELNKLDAGSWFNPKFKQEKIPTLIEWLNLANKLKMNVNLEIKPYPGTEEKLVKAILAILDNFDFKPAIILSSFSLEALFLLREFNTIYPLACLMHQWHPDWAVYAKALKPVSINVNQVILTPNRIAEIHAAGYPIISYTVNQVERAQELFSYGVEGVFSDDPCLLNC